MAATDHAARFADGVFFVPLAGLDTVVHIIPAVAEALNFPLQGQSAEETRSPQQQLLDYLRQKQMLIVLDNFEQLLEGAGLLTEILPAAPQVQLIVTSRDRLGLHDEQLFPLDGLTFPDPLPEADVSVEAAASYTAVQLFLQAGRRVQPTLALTPENLPTILRLCRQLSGIPLALELAASWLDTLALEAIAGEIQQNLDLLAADWQDMPARHRSFRAAMATSWQRLAAPEQAAFAQLSVFRGGFTLAAAQAVVVLPAEHPPIARLLARLINKSFLSFDPQENRYHIHELLRQYAGEKVAGEQAGARERHARYFAEFLRRCEPGLKGAEEEETLAVNEASGSLRGLVWANRGLVGCALLSGDFAAAATKVEQISALLSNSVMPLLHLEGFAVIASVHDMNGRYDLAAPYHDQLIQINRKLGRFMAVADHTLERAAIHMHLGEYVSGEQMVERARLIWETHARLGICYHYQGMIALTHEDYARAVTCLQQALAIHQGTNSPGDEAGALALLALAHSGLLDYAEAGQLLHRSRQLVLATHGFIPLMENLLASARLLAMQGQAEMALELYALAMRYPFVANSRLYDDIAGRYIRRRTTYLPSDTHQAAWQRGQARDLWPTAEALLVAPEAHLS